MNKKTYVLQKGKVRRTTTQSVLTKSLSLLVKLFSKKIEYVVDQLSFVVAFLIFMIYVIVQFDLLRVLY